MRPSDNPRAHPLFKFGKKKAKRDKRNLMFAAILRAPVKLPSAYDFDVKHRGVPTPMFANDVYGDCVIAGRAHQTLRFELIEQGSKIMITDRDVLREYLKETGGVDSGLNVLDSLVLWRKRGWPVGSGKMKRTYKIKAFSELEPRNHGQVKQAVYLDVGVGIGLSLTDVAEEQTQTGQVWDLVRGPRGKSNPRNGHYVYVSGYNPSGPVCVTWGRKQQMTWRFFDACCDEAYAIIDAMDTVQKKRALDGKKLDAFLRAL